MLVLHPEYVRFATFYGFKPDFCEAADPESKGMVENLAGYVQRDLLVPAELEQPWPDLTEANAAARAWCTEVNGRVHSETAAVPLKRLQTERSVLRPLPVLRPPLPAVQAPHPAAVHERLPHPAAVHERLPHPAAVPGQQLPHPAAVHEQLHPAARLHV